MLHVWDINSNWEDRKDTRQATKKSNGSDYIQKQQIGSKIESENISSIEMMSKEYCSNSKQIIQMQSRVGKLCRVGTLEGTTWTKNLPKKPCTFVLPDNESTQLEDHASVSKMPTGGELNELYGSGKNQKNQLMLVEKIACETDRLRVASFIGIEIENKISLENIFYDIQHVKWYGFNHIIIIGEVDCGLFFLDCFGRAFKWDSMELLLWPLGNYLKDSHLRLGVPWGVADEDDGIVFEVEREKHNIQPIAKKNKKSKGKSKGLKKRHH